MSNDVLQAFVRSYIAEQPGSVVVSPGRAVSRRCSVLSTSGRIVTLQDRYADGRPIQNALQTNGVLLDDAWCVPARARFFCRHLDRWAA